MSQFSMTARKKSAALQELNTKLRKAQMLGKNSRAAKAPHTTNRSGLSLAMRLGVELVSALVIGVGIGLLLDYWLETKPWFMLLFFLIGSAAGIMNVYRVATGIGYGIGYKAEDKTKDSNDPAD